jgi:hypothetical protein
MSSSNKYITDKHFKCYLTIMNTEYWTDFVTYFVHIYFSDRFISYDTFSLSYLL